MIRFLLFAVLSVAPLSACVEHDLRHYGGALLPTGEGVYHAKMPADLQYPLDDPKAESQRLRVLATWMRDEGYCPAGYSITDRKAVLRSHGLLSDTHDVVYTVECKT